MDCSTGWLAGTLHQTVEKDRGPIWEWGREIFSYNNLTGQSVKVRALLCAPHQWWGFFFQPVSLPAPPPLHLCQNLWVESTLIDDNTGVSECLLSFKSKEIWSKTSPWHPQRPNMITEVRGNQCMAKLLQDSDGLAQFWAGEKVICMVVWHLMGGGQGRES